MRTTADKATFTIATDGKSALQAIANPSNKSGHQVVRNILDKAGKLRTLGIEVNLLWAPGHSGRQPGQRGGRPRGRTDLPMLAGGTKETEPTQNAPGLPEGGAELREGQTPTQDCRRPPVKTYTKALRPTPAE